MVLDVVVHNVVNYLMDLMSLLIMMFGMMMEGIPQVVPFDIQELGRLLNGFRNGLKGGKGRKGDGKDNVHFVIRRGKGGDGDKGGNGDKGGCGGGSAACDQCGKVH